MLLCKKKYIIDNWAYISGEDDFLFKRLICYFLILIFTLNFITIVLATEVSQEPSVVAPSAVVIDAKTGLVAFDKNMNEKNYPASITKVMTALLTIEYAKAKPNGFEEKIPFSRDAVFTVRGTSNIAMDEGETLTIKEALYGLMLASANEVANALAEYIGGDNVSFAGMMTKRAKELGAVNTHFANPHGLSDEEHYTTAYDMAIIMRQAITHQEFVDIIKTQYHEIPPTERQPKVRPLNNSHKMMQPTSKNFFNEDVIGGKTGFTNNAMHTLVTYGKRGGDELIVVVMKDEKNETYKDTKLLLDYGFSQMEEVSVFNKDGFSKTMDVFNDAGENVGKVKLKAENSISVRIPKNAAERVLVVDNLPESYDQSVKVGEVLGDITIECDGFLIAESPIVAQNAVVLPEKEETPAETISDDETSFVTDILVWFKNIIKPVAIAFGVLLSLVAARAMLIYFRRKYRRSVKYKSKNVKKSAYRYKKRI